MQVSSSHENVDQQDVVRNTFPATYFLDRQLFSHCQLSIQKPQVSLSLGDVDCLDSTDSIRHVAGQYFRTIHLWLPILSRSKFYGIILHQELQKEADLRLHLCTPDPSEKHFLPISDDDWNTGVWPDRIRPDLFVAHALSQVGCRLPYTVSAPTNNKMGKFARLAQASHLLARVMRHICDTQADSSFLDTEKRLLDHALRSLLTLTVAEEQDALLLLHSFHLAASPSANKENANYRYRDVTEITSKVTLPIARRLKELSPSDAHAPSPLLLDWMYRSVIAYNNVRETDTSVLLNGYVETVREAMEVLSRQWAVGGTVVSSTSADPGGFL
ncbi:hypothetical protein APSETT445_004858 [Aspergillus pseudonomiae]